MHVSAPRLARLTLDRHLQGDRTMPEMGRQIPIASKSTPASGRHLACLLALAMVQSACSQPVRPDQLAQPDKKVLGRVAVVPAAFEPERKFEAFTTGNDKAAQDRAAGNVGECAQFLRLGLVPIVGWVLGPALAAGCVPVAAVVSTPEARSPAQVESRKLLTERATAGLRVQEIAAEATVRYANAVGYQLPLLANPSAPADGSGASSYDGLKGAADSLIEIAVMRVEGVTTGKAASDPVFIKMQLRARLLQARDGKVVDGFSFEYNTPARSIEAWLADGGQILAHDLERGLSYFVEQAIDEMLLVYHPSVLPRPKPEKPVRATTTDSAVKPDEVKIGAAKPAGTESVPAYTLWPVEPPLRNRHYRMRRMTVGHLERYPLNTLQPTLRWEAWPRGFDITPGDGPGQAQDLHYELRIFESSPGELATTAAVPFYTRTGLRAVEHTVDPALQPCMTYRWTARAVFVLNGTTRVTEWAGAYDVVVGGRVGPWQYRRGETVWGSMNLYFPIIETPSTDGAPCPNR